MITTRPGGGFGKGEDKRTAAGEHLKAADRYLKAGEFDKAKEEVEKCLAMDPGNFYAIAFKDRITSAIEEQAKKKEEAQKEAAEKTEIARTKQLEEERKRAETQAKLQNEEEERKHAEEDGRSQARLKKMQEYLQRAREFIAEKEYEDALIEINKVYVLDPSSSEARQLEEQINDTQKQSDSGVWG